MKKKWIIGLTSAIALSTFMVGCAKDEEPTPEEIQFEQNVSNAPKLSKETIKLIKESRGTPLLDEDGVESETGEIVGSYSPGAQMEQALSTMTKEQLQSQDKVVQINIFINGIIRDEYIVPATTLYGEKTVKEFKEAFRKTLLTKEGETGDEEMPQTTIVDRLGILTSLKDSNVANHYVEDIVTQMNRSYIQVSIENEFDEKVTLKGDTYRINLMDELQLLTDSATDFVKLSDEWEYTDEDLKGLNDYYNELFLETLQKSKIDVEYPVSGQIGGFLQNEDGLWVPSDMVKLTSNILDLVYLTKS